MTILTNREIALCLKRIIKMLLCMVEENINTDRRWLRDAR